MAAARKAAAFVSRLEWAVITVLSPLFLLPPVGHLSLTLILCLPLVWIVALIRTGEPIPRTPLNGSLALLSVMVLVSLYATFDIFFSAGKVLGVVFGVAVFFAIVRSVRAGFLLERLVDLFTLAGAALAVIGLLGTNWVGKLPQIAMITSRLPAVIRGVPGQSEGFQPNAIAGALVMFIPVQLALTVVAARRSHRAAGAIALLLTFGTLLLTQSRGAYVSLFVGVVAWAIWHGVRSRRVAIAGLAVIAIAAIPLHKQVSAVLFSAAGAGAGVASDVHSRVELWSRAMLVIQDFPLTGAGMNTFRRIMPVMYPVFLTPPDVDVAHAHNHLLQAAVDLGTPGLIAYLALWFGAAAMLAGAYRATQDRSRRWVLGGTAAGMIAYFLFGTADAIALGAKVGIFFWIALALIVSMYGEKEQTA